MPASRTAADRRPAALGVVIPFFLMCSCCRQMRQQTSGWGIHAWLPPWRSISAAGASGDGGSRYRGALGGDFVPYPAGEVQPVALGLPGCGISDVGVKRVPVVG